MNVIEAIKSGKRFRRKSWNIDDWVSQDRDDLPLRLNRGDVKADDWEIEERPVTITLSQFFEAWQKATAKSHELVYLGDILASELGL